MGDDCCGFLQLEGVHALLTDFVLQLLTPSCTNFAGLHGPLRLHIRILQLIGRQNGALSVEAITRLLGPRFPFTHLRQSSPDQPARQFFRQTHISDSAIVNEDLVGLFD